MGGVTKSPFFAHFCKIRAKIRISVRNTKGNPKFFSLSFPRVPSCTRNDLQIPFPCTLLRKTSIIARQNFSQHDIKVIFKA